MPTLHTPVRPSGSVENRPFRRQLSTERLTRISSQRLSVFGPGLAFVPGAGAHAAWALYGLTVGRSSSRLRLLLAATHAFHFRSVASVHRQSFSTYCACGVISFLFKSIHTLPPNSLANTSVSALDVSRCKAILGRSQSSAVLS
uniref:Uncharacterized protein n=1 Tax=Plectus sambesii TaxID=2011161 RepID=A0A914UJ33_9BILA